MEQRASNEAFRRREEAVAVQRILAMQRGTALFKYDRGKGLFHSRSEGTRIVRRLSASNPGLADARRACRYSRARAPWRHRTRGSCS